MNSSLAGQTSAQPLSDLIVNTKLSGDLNFQMQETLLKAQEISMTQLQNTMTKENLNANLKMFLTSFHKFDIKTPTFNRKKMEKQKKKEARLKK